MNKNIYDVVIIGGGVAGAFAAYKLSENVKASVCLIEFGRPPGKRRKQLEGWFGCFPSSNARLYENDFENIKTISGSKIATPVYKYIKNTFGEFGSTKSEIVNYPKLSIVNKTKKLNFTILKNEYCQWYPESVHALSRHVAETIEKKGNVEFSFDNNVENIKKENDEFIIQTEEGTIKSKIVLICAGRSGWRFANKLYKDFDIVKRDDYSYFGFRAEMPASFLSEWNKSHCTLISKDLYIGPLSWQGTVIPEDHDDLVISSWRSNEDRWKSEKVAFSVLMKEKFKDKGLYQTERLGKLAYVLSDNRVGRGRIKELLKGYFDILLIPEYVILKEKIKIVDKVFSSFIEKGSFHIPDIKTDIPKLKINKYFETDFDGLFVAGESSGTQGIYAAAISGAIAADGITIKLG